MRDRLGEFGNDAAIALITFAEADNSAPYRSRMDLPFPMLVDTARETYRSYGLERGSFRRIWGPKTAKRYIEIFRANGISRPGRPTEDTLQLGGNFVIDRRGTITYAFRGRGPDERPDVGELINAIQDAGP